MKRALPILSTGCSPTRHSRVNLARREAAKRYATTTKMRSHNSSEPSTRNSSTAMPDRSPLSVVVPTRDRPELLSGCLDALATDLGQEDEVIVVDSASQSDAVRRIAEEKAARCLRLDEPGASKARNAGWRAAKHGIVAFVDDDVRVCGGWADALVVAFADAEYAFVTGRVDAASGDEQVERQVGLTTADESFVID